MKLKTMKGKYLIMCVGHTHTGKTTFAKKISKVISSLTIIDNDEIALFLKRKYPLVFCSNYNISKKTFKDPNFKFLLFTNILDFCLSFGGNIILSNGNLGKDIRSLIKRKVKKYGYEIILIYFNLSKEEIKRRIKKTKRSTEMFVHSKNFSQVLRNQDKYAILPPSKRGVIYLEIKEKDDYQKVFNEVKNYLS